MVLKGATLARDFEKEEVTDLKHEKETVKEESVVERSGGRVVLAVELQGPKIRVIMSLALKKKIKEVCMAGQRGEGERPGEWWWEGCGGWVI